MIQATRRDGNTKETHAGSLESEDPADEVALVLPRPGDVVGDKYRIEKVIGRGGMGVVYAAHHLVLDQRVALKLLLVDSLQGNETVERFLREAQASARLRSDHVVRVMDAGALNTGHPFLAMEYLEGCDMAELVSLEGPQPCDETADYMLQALAALAQAHAAGIVHRDLKPANLFLAVCADGSNILKILDFGISKQPSDRSHWKDLTGQAVLGTPVYMSPEQLRSSKSVDPRADLWSLGVVMYELLTGKVPFDGDGPGEVFAAVLERTPESVRVHRPDLSAAWEDVVMRCLRRDPKARFQDAGELAECLAPLGSGRWSHLTAGIRLALARPAALLPKEGIALVAAAVAAAHASMPPPRQSTGGGSGRDLGLPTVDIRGPLRGVDPPSPDPAPGPARVSHPTAADPGQFVGVVPVAGRAFGPRSYRRPVSIAAGVLLAGGIVLASRGAFRAPHPPVEIPRQAALTAAPPAPATPVPVPAEQESPDPVTPAPDEPPPAQPSAAPYVAKAAPPQPLPGHRAVPVPVKRSPGPRPTFLKSWR